MKSHPRDFIVKQGRKCGYPLCCVRWFAGTYIHLKQSQRDKYFRMKCANTLGYVPCPKCAPAVKALVRAFQREMKWLFPKFKGVK